MADQTGVGGKIDVIGIDVGGTKVLAVRVSADGEILDRELVESRADTPGALEQIESSIQTLMDRSGSLPGAVGIGMAGFIDLEGIARTAPNSSGLLNVDVPGRLRERFGVPIAVENDANCVAVATWAELAHPVDTLVAVTLGTGIGGGVVVGGELYRGAHGFAGEPGHMVIDPSGPECPCGQRGCWERFASGSGLQWLARRSAAGGGADPLIERAGSIEAISGEDVAALAGDGDPSATRVFEEFAYYVALGLANLIVILDPSVVVIGGGLAALGDQLLAPVEDVLERSFPSAYDNRNTRIMMAPEGPVAGALGAAILGRRAVDPVHVPGS